MSHSTTSLRQAVEPRIVERQSEKRVSPQGHAALARGHEGIFSIQPLTVDEHGQKKKPRLNRYQTEATNDPTRIETWWRQWPEDNVGGVIPPGLVVLDCDPRHGGDTALAALEKEHGRLPVTVTVWTAGGGSHSYFCLPSDLTPKQSTYEVAGGNALELLCRGHNLVLPGSITKDRSYTYAQGKSPAEVAIALCPDWLLAFITRRDTPRPAHIVTTAKTNEARVPRVFPDGTRNKGMASTAGHLLNQGIRDQALSDALLDANARQCLPRLDLAEVKQVAQSMQRTHDRKGQNQLWASQNRAAILEIQAAALHCPWPGRTGLRQQVAMLTFCKIAYACARRHFQASERQVAESAGITRNTLRKAIPALIDKGWLTIDRINRPRAGRDTHATVYGLSLPQAAYVRSCTNKGGAGGVGLLGQEWTAHDMFRWGGLGKAALVIVVELAAGPLSEKVLIERTQKPRSTVKRVLQKLVSVGMVIEAEQGFCLVEKTEEEMDRIAERLRTFGRGERQQRQHQFERERYRRQVEKSVKRDGTQDNE